MLKKVLLVLVVTAILGGTAHAAQGDQGGYGGYGGQSIQNGYGGHDQHGNFDPPVAAPEPGSLLLLLSGLGAMGWRLRRRLK